MHRNPVARGVFFLVAFIASMAPAGAHEDRVTAKFDLSAPANGPFPSDRFTVADPGNVTGLRVNLPKDACDTYKTDCRDIGIVNTLDGFSLQPLLSIPFTGKIDVNTVSSKTVFLVRLERVTEAKHQEGEEDEAESRGDEQDGDRARTMIGINQIVWDVATATLHVESEDALEQYTRYALIVTSGVRDASGRRVQSSEEFRRFLGEPRTDAALKEYRKQLRKAVSHIADDERGEVIAASVFTTLSATPVMERIRDTIKAGQTQPADFRIGPNGSWAVYRLSPVTGIVSVTGIVFNRHTGTGKDGLDTFAKPVDVRLPLLQILKNEVENNATPAAWIAFGKYLSPSYLESETAVTFKPFGTASALPEATITPVYFNLLLPSGPRPDAGWPVVIYGLGTSDNKNANLFNVAAVLTAHGFAVMSINSVGGGGGPRSTLEVQLNNNQKLVIPAGGRSVDQNGDGIIGATEGQQVFPVNPILGRDARRQQVVDMLQLVREIEVGMDVDDDHHPDIDASRIYYLSNSLGSGIGVHLVALEPRLRGAVLTSLGGLPFTNFRLAPPDRAGLIAGLGARIPSLLNVPAKNGDLVDFDANIPLRDVDPVINTTPGAIALQKYFDRGDWINAPSIGVSYARHLRAQPLAGVTPAPLIISFARGDQTVPNPLATAILRASGLSDRTSFFRNDLAYLDSCSQKPPACVRKDPHSFLLRVDEKPNLPYALMAQRQAARFFASDPEFRIEDPDGDRPFFEVPIEPQSGWRLGLPEDLAFIP